MSKPVYDKPSHNEDEYFARQDAALIQQLRAEHEAHLSAAERQSHLMKCPKCGAGLEERDRNGIKIDVCPDCHGVWLDQGEIDLLNRVAKENPGTRMMQDILSFFHRPPRP